MYDFFATCIGLLVDTKLFWAAAFGAFVLYTLNQLNNRQPFSLLTALNVKMSSRPMITFGDMMISSAIGAGVVLLLLHPASPSEAGSLGLGLTGILSAFGKEVK
jgi:hypothetical protein